MCCLLNIYYHTDVYTDRPCSDGSEEEEVLNVQNSRIPDFAKLQEILFA